jgi:hypothetical protein
MATDAGASLFDTYSSPSFLCTVLVSLKKQKTRKQTNQKHTNKQTEKQNTAPMSHDFWISILRKNMG